MDKRDKRKKRVFQLGILLLFGNDFVSEVSKFFLWKCFEAGNGASYRLGYQDQTDLLPIEFLFIHYLQSDIWQMCTGER